MESMCYSANKESEYAYDVSISLTEVVCLRMARRGRLLADGPERSSACGWPGEVVCLRMARRGRLLADGWRGRLLADGPERRFSGIRFEVGRNISP